MNKKEFLDALGKRLSQQLSQEKVAEHIQYYDRYLTEKMMQGMTEEEAVAQLGNPLLIARTIMDTAVEEEEPKVVYEENASGGYQRSSREEAATATSCTSWENILSGRLPDLCNRSDLGSHPDFKTGGVGTFPDLAGRNTGISSPYGD